MTTHVGKEGLVEVGGNTIGELVGWRMTEGSNLIDDGELADDWETHKVARKRWSGELTLHLDPSDATGQEVLDNGTEVVLNLKGVGNTGGDTYWTGTATIEETTREAQLDQLAERSVTFRGQGPLTQTTV